MPIFLQRQFHLLHPHQYHQWDCSVFREWNWKQSLYWYLAKQILSLWPSCALWMVHQPPTVSAWSFHHVDSWWRNSLPRLNWLSVPIVALRSEHSWFQWCKCACVVDDSKLQVLWYTIYLMYSPPLAGNLSITISLASPGPHNFTLTVVDVNGQTDQFMFNFTGLPRKGWSGSWGWKLVYENVLDWS